MDPDWDDPCWEGQPFDDCACEPEAWDDIEDEDEEDEDEEEFLGFLAGDIAADTDFLSDLFGF